MTRNLGQVLSPFCPALFLVWKVTFTLSYIHKLWFIAGSCLVTSALLLHICVAAMLIWKPPAKYVSEAGKIKKVEAEYPIKAQLSSTEGVFVCPSAATNKEKQSWNHDAKTVNLPLTDNQGFEDKPSVLTITPSAIFTGTPEENLIDNSIKHHTITVLKNKHFLLFMANCFLYLFGASVLFTHLTAFSESLGKSVSFGNIMLSVQAAATTLGRVILNALCQQKRVNSVLLYIVAVTFSGEQVKLRSYVCHSFALLLFGFEQIQT